MSLQGAGKAFQAEYNMIRAMLEEGGSVHMHFPQEVNHSGDEVISVWARVVAVGTEVGQM